MNYSAQFDYVYQWFAERLSLNQLIYFLRKKSVPIHRHTIWYYLGNILLTAILIQIVTGIVLTFHYQPTPATAYESIKTIISEIKYGWLIRSIHKWGAYFMIAAAWIHLFSTFFFKAYRRPRELIWWSGVILFTLIMMLGFSGYLLPWSEHAFFATRVGTGIAGQVPIIGSGLKIFLRGGTEISDLTLTRFFALHVVVLPLAILLLGGLHLLLIQIHGLSVPASLENRQLSLKRIPFFPEFILQDLAISCWVTASIVALAVFFPCELGKKFDPILSTPESVLPEWYFLFMFKTLQMLPAQIGPLTGAQVGIFGFGVGFLLIFFAPLLERIFLRVSGRIFNISGIIMITFVIVMTILALINYDRVPSIEAIDLMQNTLAHQQLPGLLIFLPTLIALGIFLWLKARDLALLRIQGFFSNPSEEK